jgi:ATP-dependent exoDNAse (exonuclease V) alpha subunit
MVQRLATSGAGVQIVVGKAGAGKTTALAVTREVFASAGYVVSGTALSARAAEELEVSAGIPSVTLARLLGELDDGTRVIGPRDVLVIDEAGMVGTRTIGRLIDEASSGAKLILVGDPRQLANHHTFARTCGRWRLKFRCSAGVGHGQRCRPSNRARWRG